jgi:uncharacterized protein (DUF1778 family)
MADARRAHGKPTASFSTASHGFPCSNSVTMSDQAQISASVSAATKERLDEFSESHGLKKNYVVEQALLFFMDARRDLPDEALLPTRLVLADDAFRRMVAQLERPAPPTDALRELMRDQGR